MLMAGCTCIVFAGLRLNLKFMGLNLRRREDMERQELIREDDRERSRMRTRALVQVGICIWDAVDCGFLPGCWCLGPLITMQCPRFFFSALLVWRV